VPPACKTQAKKADLITKLKQSAEEAKNGRISPSKAFLGEVKDVVEEALDNNVSYKQLSKDIYDIYSFKISEATIRAFAYSTLGITPKKRKAKNTTVATEKAEPKTSLEIKKDMAKKVENKDEVTL